MRKQFLISAVLVSLLLPIGTAFAGASSDFDAQIIRVGSEKVIFGEEGGVVRYIHFCGAFAGDVYYGTDLVETTSDLSILQHDLPLNSNVHFKGAITGGTEMAGGAYSYCLSDGAASTITIATQSYTVKRGDTLASILRTLGGSSRDSRLIAGYNGFANPRFIRIGQVLALPVY